MDWGSGESGRYLAKTKVGGFRLGVKVRLENFQNLIHFGAWGRSLHIEWLGYDKQMLQHKLFKSEKPFHLVPLAEADDPEDAQQFSLGCKRRRKIKLLEISELSPFWDLAIIIK